jgi:uncharacterized protein (DUF4415 family)
VLRRENSTDSKSNTSILAAIAALTFRGSKKEIALPRLEKHREGNDDFMKTKMVSYTWETMPPLTEEDWANLRALAARSDSEIDLSDVPEMTDEEWKNVERGHFYRPVKRQITARVDADVLAWLKSQGKGYQSRINAILRREMLTAHRAAAK